jgi:hypothetical protein
MSNFKKLVEARMAETGEGWQAASKHVRELVLEEESEGVKEYVRKLKAGTSFPCGSFIGPRAIEPGQTIELIEEAKVEEWPWSPTRLEFIKALQGQSLFLETMTIGRRDQIHGGGGIPLDAFISGVTGIYLGADMITVEKPFRMEIRNAGTKSQLLIGYLSGIGHAVVPTDEDERHSADIERVMLHLESAALPPHSTKTVRIEPPKEQIPRLSGASVPVIVGYRPRSLTDGVEYKISNFTMSSFGKDVLVDIRIDGESVTGGFVESGLFGYSRGLAIDFNLDRRPFEFKKPYIKDKTQFEVVIKNDSEHPHDFMGILNVTRHLTLSEIEARHEERRNPAPRVMKHQERFPWNIEGKKEMVEVAPGETRTLAGQPQCIFRGKELVVDPECRDHFEIVDVKVGLDPSPLFDKPIHASRFHEDNGLDLKLDAASPGIIMRLIVKNVSKEARDFGATVKGDALF